MEAGDEESLCEMCATLSPLGCYYGGLRVGDPCPGYVPNTPDGLFHGLKRTCFGNGRITENKPGVSVRKNSKGNTVRIPCMSRMSVLFLVFHVFERLVLSGRSLL